MTTPPFAVDLAPPGVEYRPVEFWRERPKLDDWRSIFVHTMAASVPTSVQSGWNHAHRNPHTNTCPTYAVGLEDGDAAKFLPSDRRSIATTTVTRTTTRNGKLVWPTLEQWQRDEIARYGNVRDWSLSIETADTGYLTDPAISAFNDWQIEAVSTIVAYEAKVGDFPIDMLARWFSAGVGSHTDPDDYPFTTLYPGKFCPGSKKKAQVRADIIPEARRILASWTAPPADPPPLALTEVPPDMWIVAKTDQGFLASPGIRQGAYKVPEQVPYTFPWYADVTTVAAGQAYDLATGRPVGGWQPMVEVISEAEALAYMGPRVP